MHSLEADGPELQALDAIRRLVVPLVEKRIAEGTKNAESLDIQNSLDLLRFEMSSLLFWITKGHQLDDQDHETFLQDLQPVLQLLEECIDPQIVGQEEGESSHIPNSTEQRRYPRLHAIIKKASQGSTRPNDTKFDLARAISLPDSEDPARAAYETVTKFNANNQKRDHGAHTQPFRTRMDHNCSGFQAENTFIQESKLYASMFKAWTHHFGASGCHHRHVGMLQASAFEMESPKLQHVVQHKMFVSACAPEGRWQEVACTIVGNLPETPSSLCEIKNICQTIGNSLSYEEKLSLWICSERIWHDSEDDPHLVENLDILPTLSLKKILERNARSLRANGRVTLAYNLACTLLRVYSVDMQQQEWGPGDIYFLHNPTEDTIHEPDYPFVASTFLSSRTASDIKNRFPVLIHFAKLLLEIGLGQLFVPSRSRLDFELMKWAQSDEANQSLIESYLDAIMECLQAKKPRQVGDPADEEIQCRKVIFNLVSHLNKARQSYRALDPKRTERISMLDSTISEPTVNHRPPQQNPLSCEDLSDLLPKNRMFDEQKLRLYNADTSHIETAKAFLDLAERFYTSSMRDLTCSPDIRIAILDTGIQTRNSFIRGVQKSRRGRDSPIKESKSFVSHDSEDECGHGTNVASLILRIFPEANLYVAKIARGLEQDGVEQVVEAIRWARSFDVHIINMSFSIPKTPAVTRCINNAESNGVIMFAAASNNGIRTGRSFPATLDTVLCIHATNGDGDKGSMNPDPEPDEDNFSTLGVAVPSVWEKDIYLSGTSYATPVAATMAAVILAFVEAAVAMGKMSDESKEEVFRRQGMKKILKSMTMRRDGYSCIAPWRKFWPPSCGQESLITSIRNALE